MRLFTIREYDMCHILLGPCCKLHLNLSQDQERRLERELAEERERKRGGGGGEDEQRLRGLLNEAEVGERDKTVQDENGRGNGLREREVLFLFLAYDVPPLLGSKLMFAEHSIAGPKLV